MENCLVTKLKKVVDNNNLPFLDCMCLHYSQRDGATEGTQFISINTLEPVLIEALDGGTLSRTYGGSTNTEFTINGSYQYVFVSNTTCRVLIHNKQNISKIIANPLIPFTDYNYSTNLQELGGIVDFSFKSTLPKLKRILCNNNNTVGSIDNVKNGLLEAISCRIIVTEDNVYSGLLTSFSQISDEPNLKELIVEVSSSLSPIINYIEGSTQQLIDKPIHILRLDKARYITGSIEDCAQCLLNYYNLTGNINNTEFYIADTQLGGSIQGFVNTCVNGGLTSGTIKFPYAKMCRYIYSDLNHSIKISEDSSTPASKATNTLSWSQDKTWAFAE